MKNPFLSAALAAAIISISSGNVAVAGAAYSISNFIKQAEVIKANAVVSANSTMIKVSTTIKGFAANDPYMIKNVDVPKTSFMGHVKGNLSSLTKRNLWYAGWFATVGAAGWAIDELHNQMVRVPPYTSKNNIYCWGSPGYPDFGCSFNPKDAAVQLCPPNGPYACSAPISVSPHPTRPFSYLYYFNTNQGVLSFLVNPTACTSTTSGAYLKFCSAELPSESVPDDAIYESLITEMLKDPKAAAQAFMVPDPWPYPYPHIFPDTVPYIPGVSESDQEALDWYYKGLLQSTNPNAPYYVTPERYQQIAALAQQLQQGQTPEAESDALNDALKKPLTQKELEESLKKQREAEEKANKEALGEKPSFDTLTKPLDDFIENVKKTPEDVINHLPQNNFGIAGSGTCYLIDKPISIMGVTYSMSTRSFCDAYYYPYFLPILTWFFFVATGLYIWFSLRDAYSRRI